MILLRLSILGTLALTHGTSFAVDGFGDLPSSMAENEEIMTDTSYQSTNSGLQYRVIDSTATSDKKPTASQRVEVDYEGKLDNGNVFDSSYERKQPTQFMVNQVIPGWQEALSMMKEGETWEVAVPPQLAYGANGVSGVIPPNSTLTFKIHLRKIVS